jgi:hypothetical protein
MSLLIANASGLPAVAGCAAAALGSAAITKMHPNTTANVTNTVCFADFDIIPRSKNTDNNNTNTYIAAPFTREHIYE